MREINSLTIHSFTFEDGNGSFRQVTEEEIAGFKKFALINPRVTNLEIVLPHLLIWCHHPPRYGNRDESFAGLNAVWLPTEVVQDEPGDRSVEDIPLHVFYNNDRGNPNVLATFSDEIEEDMAEMEDPKTKTIEQIFLHCSGARAVFYWGHTVFVELLPLPEAEHRERLTTLPTRFRRSQVKLFYKNGGESPPGPRYLRLVRNENDPMVEMPEYDPYTESDWEGGSQASRRDGDDYANGSRGPNGGQNSDTNGSTGPKEPHSDRRSPSR